MLTYIRIVRGAIIIQLIILNKIKAMKTNESIDFYITLINNNVNGLKKVKFVSENGTNYIKTLFGNEIVYQGTKGQCYCFLVGVSRLID